MELNIKIRNKELRNLYKAYIMENAPPSRKNCPPVKKIINSFESKIHEKQKTKIINHIANCFYCSQEFEFILETLRYEKRLNKEIYNILEFRSDRTYIKKRIEKYISHLKKIQKIFFPKFIWRYALLLLGIVIITSSIIIFQVSEKREYRGTNLQKINLIEPINGKYSKFFLPFKWNEYNDSYYYILELFDETLFPIWKSDKILSNHIVLPYKIAKKLGKNKTYYWMITAFLLDGEKIESDIKEFTVKD